MGKPLSRSKAEEKIKALREKIIFHEGKYYRDHDPQISDFEFDVLVKELEGLEKEFPDLITPESPTQRIGEKPLEGFETVPHRAPMLSLDNCYTPEELYAFEDRIRKSLSGKNWDYVVELKIDGVGISIIYRNGKFSQAITRGDGIRGDDVTTNIKTIKSLPLVIQTSKEVEVRGEVFLPFASFQQINREREAKEESLFANPRNAAAGSIRLLDPKEVALRKLDVFLYSIFMEGKEMESQWRNLEVLKELGFKTNPVSRKCHDLKQVISIYKEWQEERDSLAYDVDGIVIKLNSTELQRQLGQTSKFPRWAISLKFPARQAKTQVNDIRIQVGRTGALTPVAILEPVKLSGIIISRATLHNEDEIKRKDIRIGDTVLIERSGDVIPKVIAVVKEKRTGREKKFTFPTKCPVCHSRIFKPPGEIVSRCMNPSCQAAIKRSILHFASRQAMNIEGLGEALVDQLLQKRLIKEIPDIYSLKKEDLVRLERMGEKSSQNLLSEIEQSKDQDVYRLIFALGVRYVGERTARVLATRYGNLDVLTKASFEELVEIDDIGPKVGESIIFFFRQPENQRLINRLRTFGLNFATTEVQSEGEKILAGKTFVLTGTLSHLKREKAKEIIENLGGRVSSALSKKTHYLVVGESPGSKLQKAQKLNISLLSEEEFLMLVKKLPSNAKDSTGLFPLPKKI